MPTFFKHFEIFKPDQIKTDGYAYTKQIENILYKVPSQKYQNRSHRIYVKLKELLNELSSKRNKKVALYYITLMQSESIKESYAFGHVIAAQIHGEYELSHTLSLDFMRLLTVHLEPKTADEVLCILSNHKRETKIIIGCPAINRTIGVTFGHLVALSHNDICLREYFQLLEACAVNGANTRRLYELLLLGWRFKNQGSPQNFYGWTIGHIATQPGLYQTETIHRFIDVLICLREQRGLVQAEIDTLLMLPALDTPSTSIHNQIMAHRGLSLETLEAYEYLSKKPVCEAAAFQSSGMRIHPNFQQPIHPVSLDAPLPPLPPFQTVGTPSAFTERPTWLLPSEIQNLPDW